MKKTTEEMELLPVANQPTYQQPTQMAVREAQPLSVAPVPQELNLQSIADRILSGDLTNEKLTMIKDLVAMDAERKFAVAFNAMQAELPVIVASSVIPNRGRYERFEDVMRQIQPFLTKHGFTVSFSNDFRDGRIIETCTLKHIGGHSQSNNFAVRVSGKADSETQADCKAATTAKRNSLLNALNIVIRQDCLSSDNDASIEGGNITESQADELERRVALLNQSHPAFLKWLQVAKYADIPSGKYQMADDFLKKKEQGR